MAIAFQEIRRLPGMRAFRISGKLTFSGNYVTGGEVPTGLIQMWTAKDAFGANFYNKGAYTFKYDPVTKKIIVYLAGAELAAGAYPAAVTNDVVTMDVEFSK